MNRPLHGGNLNWAATVAGCPVSLLTDFSASINPLGTPKTAIASIINNISQLTVYPDPGYADLRSHLAKYHKIDHKFILPGNGSAELLTWAARELAQQKFTYLITPAFSDYARALNAFDGKIYPCPLPLNSCKGELPFAPSPQTSPLPIPISPRSESGLLLNNPHNPTGKLWTREEILPCLQQFSLVVVDEAFMDFLMPSEEQSLIPLIGKYPNLVILRSLTKFYSLPGLRIGYAIAHPERLQKWQKWRDPWSVNALAVVATKAAIQDQEFQQQTWNWLATARSRLFEQLQAIPGLHPFPSAANYLLVKTEISATKLQEKLLTNYQIVIRDCLSFPELGDRYFRIAVRLPAENDRLVEAIAAIV
ncbi:threonine-phosphate decarboxylase CobD [Pleurocapsa sp. PCC 7319]|uniref:threonine-phosphate decarboxylase CobD n=1 Tax=Pleurocapsa sp. PCC 7319 TaxID=118161 RepID=UPI0003624F9D|nr:threonine-phosphate decarboxylase CobD [Pleurocapsa sp. PCC 7319]